MSSMNSHKPPDPFEPFAGLPEAKRHFCRHLLPSHACTAESCKKDYQEWLTAKFPLVSVGTTGPQGGPTAYPYPPPPQRQPAGPLCPPPTNPIPNFKFDPKAFFSVFNFTLVRDIMNLLVDPSYLSQAFTWDLSYEGRDYWNWHRNQPTLDRDADVRLQFYFNLYQGRAGVQANASSPTP